MKPRVLVAEDNALNRELVRQLLEDDYELGFAEDGERAVELALSLPPDAVLMDLSLPRVDGWEATRRLRSDPRTAAVPVVALTAHAIGGYRERALDAGFAAYLTKPIDEDELFATLRRLTRPAPARPVARDPAALLAAVREHLPGLLSAARDAHDRGDLAALAGVAHQLKGGAQMAALAEVGALARRLEDAARSGDAARAGALLAAVEASAAALLG